MHTLRARRDSSLWPPAFHVRNESPDESVRRSALGHEAKLASDRIDQALSLEQSRRKKNSTAKILLLGQSESGKSTTFRNFQLNLAPRAFQADAEAWRTVIHLNLLISMNYLLDVLRNSVHSTDAGSEQRPPYPPGATPSRQLIEREKMRLRSLDGSLGCSSPVGSGRSSPSYSTELRRLMLSLLPLKSIETTLRQHLGAESPVPHAFDSSKNLARERKAGSLCLGTAKPPNEPFMRPASALSLSSSNSSGSMRSKRFLGLRRHSISLSVTSSSSSTATPAPIEFEKKFGGYDSLSSSAMTKEGRRARRSSKLHSFVDSFAVKVRGSTGWTRRARIPSADEQSGLSHPRLSFDEMSEQDERELLNARQIIQVFGDDIDRLWKNEDVQNILKRLGIRLVGQPGFFLDDVLRVTAQDYVPTTTDILRARLSTTGVEEHKLVLEEGREAGNEWIIYDVGGSRSQRAAWIPFFDSVNLIIFLAPISSFDEWLAEDPSVNRLEDTFHLWREICGNRLLASVEFILFLNKYDVLRTKLRSGIRFSDYVVNYDDEQGKKNDPESISKYMLATFSAAHKQLSPKPRKLRAYLTSVVDSRATSKVVNHIREQVLIGYLTDVDVL